MKYEDWDSEMRILYGKFLAEAAEANIHYQLHSIEKDCFCIRIFSKERRVGELFVDPIEAEHEYWRAGQIGLIHGLYWSEDEPTMFRRRS